MKGVESISQYFPWIQRTGFIVVSLALPQGESYLLTCFDTLIYYDVSTGKLAHGDVQSSPRNFTLVRSSQSASVNISGATDSGTEKLLREVSVRNAGNDRKVALHLQDRLASAHPEGTIVFGAEWLMAWEVFRLVREDHLNSDRYWTPSSPQGGTELMMNQLSSALGADANRIDLRVGSPEGLSIHHTRPAEDDPRPRVVWIHNDYLNPQYAWMRDDERMAKVVRLVFVSKSQRQHFLDNYDLPPERCVVIRNAIHTNKTVRPWPRNPWRWRCAYISAAFRGLDLLLEAWQEIAPENADLHIWSGQSLWALKDNFYRPLFARANSIPNVFYHRIAPNDFIRTALLDMHFHLYPCTIPICETFCLSAVEAMSAGCRVIAPSASVFPETTAGFARLYPYSADRNKHKRAFSLALEDEFAHPWEGRPDLAEAQQAYCQIEYDWSRRAGEWQDLIDEISPA